MHLIDQKKPNNRIGNHQFRALPTRKIRILDSQTRARYQNQREANLLRRKLANINIEHNDVMSRFAFKRQNIKAKMYELQHEIKQRELIKRLDKRNDENTTLGINESDLFDTGGSSSLECPSLLLHNLNLNESSEWEKSFVLPSIPDEIFNKNKPLSPIDAIRSRYSSKFDADSRFFEQSELILSNNNISLKQQTEQMKRSIQIAIARSTRDSNIAARRAIHQY